jgi:hypothetical protein
MDFDKFIKICHSDSALAGEETFFSQPQIVRQAQYDTSPR